MSPTYTYSCEGCQYTFHEFARVGKGGEQCCPHCGVKLERVYEKSSGGVVFKGDGFYQTDYKDKGK